MNQYRADLHIHSVLSPCGDLEMSPHNILEKASQRGLDIIGITDHNSTLHCNAISDMAKQYGIFVLCGAEVASVEEVHCLCFFPPHNLNEFQEYLEKHIIKIPHQPEKLGYQPVVNQQEEILDQVSYSLLSALDQSIEDIGKKTQSLDGIFIPAHINRPSFSLLSQLGFVPADLNENALELSQHISREDFLKQHQELHDRTFIQSSDAHFIDDIGKVHTLFKMKSRSFDEIRLALKKEAGRNVFI